MYVCCTSEDLIPYMVLSPMQTRMKGSEHKCVFTMRSDKSDHFQTCLTPWMKSLAEKVAICPFEAT